MKRREWLSRTTVSLAGAPAALAALGKTAPGGWKHGKKWVYSITYDEGVVDLFKHAVPMHREYGIPGHLAIVSQQIGVIRKLPGSSYDGWKIMGKEEVHELVQEGWGVSCHSMTHCGVTEENAQREVVDARKVMEEKLEMPVTMFTVPGNNFGHAPSIKVAKQAGYTSILTIYDRVNTKDTDLLWLGRLPLHTEFPGPFYTAFDPYKGLLYAKKLGGWVIDYNHCPMPGRPVHPAKDATAEQLRERFDAVLEVGGEDVWIADPNEVVDFLLKDEESIQRRAEAPPALSLLYNGEMRATYGILKEEAE